MDDEKDEIDESAAPLIEHLTELRSRLIRSVVAFAICMILAFTVATDIFNFLANFLPTVDFQLPIIPIKNKLFKINIFLILQYAF